MPIKDFVNLFPIYRYNKGDIITASDLPYEGVYYINSGLGYASSNTPFRLLWFVKHGDILGLDRHFDSPSISYTIKALTSSEATFIPKEEFNKILNQEPTIQRALMENLCQKISFAEHWYRLIQKRKTEQRLIEILVVLANNGALIDQNKSKDTPIKFTIEFTPKDIALFIDTAPSYVYKLLTKLYKTKCIEKGRNNLIVKDLRKLVATVNS